MIISYRVRPLLFARKDVRWDDPGTRTEKLLLYGIGQGRMPTKPERPAGAAHVWNLVAFLVAQLGTLTSFGLAYDPKFHLPFLTHESALGQGYLFVKDLVDLLGAAGCAVFLYFRLVEKKERMTLSWEGVFILCMILRVLWSDVLIDAAPRAARRVALVPARLRQGGAVVLRRHDAPDRAASAPPAWCSTSPSSWSSSTSCRRQALPRHHRPARTSSSSA